MGEVAQVTAQRTSSWTVWGAAVGFYLRNVLVLLPLTPVLFLPVYTDVLHAALIKQELETGRLSPGSALRTALRNVFEVAWLKFAFEIAGFLWSLIPFYGWYHAERNRMYWAMASNVVVFEGLSDVTAKNRCRNLVLQGQLKTASMTLVWFPMTIQTVILLSMALAPDMNPPIFWSGVAFMFWLGLPASAAVNSFLYLGLRTESLLEAS